MAVGDLLVKDGQYEFQGLLFNGGPVEPFYMVTSVDGLWAIDDKINDSDNQVDDGEFFGEDHVASKQIIVNLDILAATEASAQGYLDSLRSAWQPQLDFIPFAFRKAGFSDKQFLWVKPRKLAAPNNWDTTKGRLTVVGELRAADPRIYELTQQLVAIPTNGNANCSQGGWYSRGSDPIIEIDGPFTNPRITNNLWARTIRLDLVVPFGQTLIIDVAAKTILMYDGANYFDYYSYKRNDNQWWSLTPGVNNIAFAATGTTSNTHCRVKWYNARI